MIKRRWNETRKRRKIPENKWSSRYIQSNSTIYVNRFREIVIVHISLINLCRDTRASSNSSSPLPSTTLRLATSRLLLLRESFERSNVFRKTTMPFYSLGSLFHARCEEMLHETKEGPIISMIPLKRQCPPSIRSSAPAAQYLINRIPGFSCLLVKLILARVVSFRRSVRSRVLGSRSDTTCVPLRAHRRPDIRCEVAVLSSRKPPIRPTRRVAPEYRVPPV